MGRIWNIRKKNTIMMCCIYRIHSEFLIDIVTLASMHCNYSCVQNLHLNSTHICSMYNNINIYLDWGKCRIARGSLTYISTSVDELVPVWFDFSST